MLCCNRRRNTKILILLLVILKVKLLDENCVFFQDTVTIILITG